MCSVIIFRLGRNPQFGFPWKDWSNFELGFKYIRVGLDLLCPLTSLEVSATLSTHQMPLPCIYFEFPPVRHVVNLCPGWLLR